MKNGIVPAIPRDCFVGVDYASQEAQLVYSWSNGDGTFDSHTACKNKRRTICNPEVKTNMWKDVDPYTVVAEKHGIDRATVKTKTYWLLYTTAFNPQTPEELIEGIEKYMELKK